MALPIDKWGKTLLIVTGCSRGLGAVICEQFSGKTDSGSVVIGISRNQQGMERTGGRVMAKNVGVKVSKPAITEGVVRTIFLNMLNRKTPLESKTQCLQI